MDIPLLFSCDEAFLLGVEHALVSISIFRKDPAPQRVYLVNCGISPQAFSDFKERLERFDPRYQLQEFRPNAQKWQQFQPSPQPGYEHEPFRRLQPFEWLNVLDDLAAREEILLCLDGDLLFLDDIEILKSHALNSHWAAACQDMGQTLRQDCPDPELVEREGDQLYFNTGVVLIHAQRYQQLNGFERILTFASRWRDQLKADDQTAFNSVFVGQIQALDRSWNQCHEYLGYIQKPKLDRTQHRVVHLWRQYKPWMNFNYMESGALWYGLNKALPTLPNVNWKSFPNYQKWCRRMNHPKLTSWLYQLRKHHDLARFWDEQAQLSQGVRSWSKLFEARIDTHRTWWREQMRQNHLLDSSLTQD